jgi:uncharacterized protein (TIGR03435 family)
MRALEVLSAIALLSALSGVLPAQSPANSAQPAFDVASVKVFTNQPAPGGTCAGPARAGLQGGPGTSDPERITGSAVSLKELLVIAYGVRPYQVIGPDWIDPPPAHLCGEPRYDVAVNVPHGATKGQVMIMWQALLKDRFGVVLHHESKVLPGEALVVAKGGPKLTPSAKDQEVPAQATDQPARPKFDQSGCIVLNAPGIVAGMNRSPNGTILCEVGKAQSLEQLATYLEKSRNHPIWDKTGLTGLYDFTVRYGPGAGGGREMDALEPQLGLKLTPAKADVDLLIIDKADKTPTAN